MKSIIILSLLIYSLFSLSLPTTPYKPSPKQIEWLNLVDQALDDPSYCRLLEPLVLSPHADQDINPILIDILVSKCI